MPKYQLMQSIPLTHIKKPDYLHFQLGGENNYRKYLKSFQEILSLLRASGLNKILIEGNPGGRISIEETILLFQGIIELATEEIRKTKIAFVDRRENNKEYAQFAENVAINRGFNFKTFNNLKEAEAWLIC